MRMRANFFNTSKLEFYVLEIASLAKFKFTYSCRVGELVAACWRAAVNAKVYASNLAASFTVP